MGQLRLNVPANVRPALGMWESAYVCGVEGIPWPGRVTWEGSTLVINRPVDESGKVFVPYLVPHCGLITLQTCSLRQSGQEYLLPLELARGSCNRVRTQADQWQRSGLRLPEPYLREVGVGTGRFLDAILLQRDLVSSSQSAHESLGHLEQAGNLLVDAYCEQALVYRKHNERQMGTLLGASLDAQPPLQPDAEKLFSEAFNTVQLRMHWAAVETDAGHFHFEAFDQLVQWAVERNIRVCGGPLLEFQAKMLPHWIYVFEDDFTGLVDAVSRYATAVVKRYRGKVHVWNCAAGLNSPGPLHLTDEQVMRLTVAVLQAVRREDPKTPVLVTVDQPWGEYLAGNPEGLSPLHFADILVRSDLGLSGIGLQIRPGYWPGGSLPRSLLDISQTLDRWAVLGLPLMVQAVFPSSANKDAMAAVATSPLSSIPNLLDGQDAWCKRFLRMLLAKPFVQGVIWDAWDDRLPHQLANSGILTSSGSKRPIADALIELRQQFLC